MDGFTASRERKLFDRGKSPRRTSETGLLNSLFSGAQMADSFDVIVIGGGPAGYPAAIRAAQNKLSVACIDEWKNRDGAPAFGGTCLNAGCIPSKALLESSELFHRLHSEFAAHGIRANGIELDLAAMQKRKTGIVKASTNGIIAL